MTAVPIGLPLALSAAAELSWSGSLKKRFRETTLPAGRHPA